MSPQGVGHAPVNAMDIKVLGRNMDVGDALSSRIRDELEDTVARYFDKAIECHATVTRQQKRFTALLRAHIARGTNVESSASAGDAHAAFDAALERMAKQLRRYKRKLVATHTHPDAQADVMQPAGMEATDYVLEDDPDSDEAAHGADGGDPVIVAETTMAIPRLSVSEAVMRMDLSGRPTLFFRHAGSGRLNAIYRRDDGNVGWIDPTEAA
ncbi:MAG: ribosome-associated translation inhibitor RaiA [Amphiplicatus sp.]